MLTRPDPAPFRRSSTVVLLLIMAAYVLWMLSLPAWPSQDGPVHLYYTSVLDALFSHAASPFRPYFFIKHLLPPYALYYYALLVLSHGVSLLVADRIVISGYVVLFILGFRYAARAIGPASEITALLASLLALNWALGMGFANYCLSMALALWAIGIWLRLGSTPHNLRHRIAFVVLAGLITLTHPVPLLIVLSFGALDLICEFLASRRDPDGNVRRVLRANLSTLCCSAVCLIYVKAFTVAHPLAQRTVQPGSFGEHVIRRIKDILIVKNVELLYGHWWEVKLYRISLGSVLLVAALLVIVQFRRNRQQARRWTPGDSMAVYAAGVALALPLMPSDMSGAYYFFERLNSLLWITTLLAASAWVPMARTRSAGRRTRWSLADLPGAGALLASTVFTLFITVLLLHAANATLRPFAERDYRLAHTELPLRGQLAMVLDGGKERKYLMAGPPWDPFYWDTVALLRRNQAIMVNPPWLDSPIIPLADTKTVPGAVLSPTLANSPLKLGKAMYQTPTLRSDLLQHSDVALFSPVPQGTGRNFVPPILGAGWTCTASRNDDYRLCQHGGPDVARLATGEPPTP